MMHFRGVKKRIIISSSTYPPLIYCLRGARIAWGPLGSHGRRPADRGLRRGLTAHPHNFTFTPNVFLTPAPHSSSLCAPHSTHCSSLSDARQARYPAALGPVG